MGSLPSYFALLSLMLFISECSGSLSHNFSLVGGLRSYNASFIGIPCGLFATSLVFFFILAFVLLSQSAEVAQTLYNTPFGKYLLLIYCLQFSVGYQGKIQRKEGILKSSSRDLAVGIWSSSVLYTNQRLKKMVPAASFHAVFL